MDQHSWAEFQEQAWSEVTAGYRGRFPQVRGWNRLFRGAECPSFDDAVGYELFRVESCAPVEYVIVRTEWRYDLDQPRFELAKGQGKISPQVEISQLGMDAHEAEDLLREFREVKMNPGTSRREFGLDGTSFEFEIGDSSASVRASWWEDGPSEWRQVTSLTREFLARMKKLSGWAMLT